MLGYFLHPFMFTIRIPSPDFLYIIAIIAESEIGWGG